MGQLKMNLDEEIEIKYKDIDQDVLEINDEEIDTEANLLYITRLKKLIKDIAEFDNFFGIMAGKESINRIQETGKYLIAMLIVQILEDLRANNRKKIKANDVDAALDKILSKASGIDTALNMLNKDIETLNSLNKNAAVTKASNFINR